MLALIFGPIRRLILALLSLIYRQSRLAGRLLNPNAHVADTDGLAGADFRRLAQFALAIDGNYTARDHVLSGASAIAQASQFQQLVELDELAFKIKSDVLHSILD
jgi:hypothetical protein